MSLTIKTMLENNRYVTVVSGGTISKKQIEQLFHQQGEKDVIYFAKDTEIVGLDGKKREDKEAEIKLLLGLDTDDDVIIRGSSRQREMPEITRDAAEGFYSETVFDNNVYRTTVYGNELTGSQGLAIFNMPEAKDDILIEASIFGHQEISANQVAVMAGSMRLDEGDSLTVKTPDMSNPVHLGMLEEEALTLPLGGVAETVDLSAESEIYLPRGYTINGQGDGSHVLVTPVETPDTFDDTRAREVNTQRNIENLQDVVLNSYAANDGRLSSYYGVFATSHSLDAFARVMKQGPFKDSQLTEDLYQELRQHTYRADDGKLLINYFAVLQNHPNDHGISLVTSN